MVALPPVPGVIKYRFFNTVGSDTNVSWHLFVKTTTSPTAAQATAAAAAASTAWGAHLAAITPGGIQLTTVSCTDLTSSDAEIGYDTTPRPGTRVGSPQLTAPVSILVNFTVHRRYRGGKPRVYIPGGLTGDLSSPQEWNTTFLSAANTAWQGFVAAVLSSLSWASPPAATCNVAYWQGHHWVPPDSTPSKKVPLPYPGGPHVDLITGSAVNALIGTQRRRVRPG